MQYKIIHEGIRINKDITMNKDFKSENLVIPRRCISKLLYNLMRKYY